MKRAAGVPRGTLAAGHAEALRLAEADYRSVFENAVWGVYRVDAEGRVVDANPALARMLGYASFEEMKADISSVARDVYVDEADRGRYRELLEKEGVVASFETRWRRRDGTILWVTLSGRRLRDPATGAPYLLGMASDITDRKRAEQELRDSEERFRSLSKLSSDFYWETDAQHRIVRNTREGETDVPGSVRARVGQAPWEAPSTHPDAAGWARHRATLDAHLPFKDFEISRLDADGQEQHVSLSGEPVFARDGSFLGYRGMGRNISDRKREARLLALEHSVSRLLVGSPSTSAGLAEVMRAVCEADGWDCGRYFALHPGSGRMRLGAQWTRPGAQFASFALAPQTVEYGPGEGLIGAAWTGGRPVWVPNVLEDPRVANRALAEAVGVHGAFLVPVRSDGGVTGIISLSSSRVRPPDARLLGAMEVVAGHVGQFLKRKSAEDALLRFRAALDGSADMVFLVDLASLRLLDFNDTASSYLGYSREELLGANPTGYLAGVTEDELRGSFSELQSRSGRADSLVRSFRRKDGKTFEAEVLRRVIDSPEGPILVVNARDLTERNMLEQRQAVYVRHQEEMARFGAIALEKREAEALVREAVQATREALRTDCIVYVERGSAEGEVMARAVAGPEAAEREPVAGGGQPLSLALDQGELAFFDGRGPVLPFPWAADFRSAAYAPVHGEGRPRGALCALSHDSQVMGIDECQFLVTVASVLSAGLRRIESEGRLAFLAQFDPLTGLPNRALLSDRLSQLIVQAGRHGTQLGALFIDLDQFKVINDTLGHAAGDELLKEAARRLERCVRPGDTVARISGDEFAVVLNDLARAEDGALVAQKVIDALAAPLRVRGQEVFVSASIGIAAFPSDGHDAESLLGAADAAMYRAKQSGRNGFQFFTSEINQRTRARAQLATELRRALEREEFALAYQPKFDLRTGMPCGAEALLRWRRPDGATVPPVEFIPVLEETGLIVPVGEWVVRRACRDLKAWEASGAAALPVAVNLSARQFRQQDLDARIEAILGEAAVSPALLELEITESQLMHDPQHAIRTVRALHETGIRIAVDDFGTGYSSLSYLTRFAMSALKIDRSFVADVLRDQAAAAIVRAIVDMAHTLGFTVVAEGVETEGQAAFLRGLGCDQAQGYLFARPMPADELLQLMAAGRLALPH